MKKIATKKPSIVPTIFVILFVIIIGMFLKTKIYNSNKSYGNNNLPKPTRSLVYEPPANNEDLQNLRNKLSAIFAGNVEYSQEYGTVPVAEFIAPNIDGRAIKYQKGNSIFKQTYEGTEWAIDLTKEVNQFKTLKTGEQEIITCAGTIGGCYKEKVTAKQLGNRKWAYVDSEFIELQRTYFTYDNTNQQMVYLTLSLGMTKRGEIPPEVNSFLIEFETDVLASV